MLFDPRHASTQSLGLELKELRYRADGRDLLCGVTARLAPHSLTVLLGPNGAGKSLTLRAIQGLIPCQSGAVQVFRDGTANAPISQIYGPREGVGIVFQDPVLFRRSVRGNIAHALRAAGFGGRDRRSREDVLLRMAGLDALADQSARVLSGGEQQKLCVIRALAAMPRILLLDEPTASLDPRATHAIETLVAKARSEGVKVVLVTHDLGQAKRLADDILFVHAGRATEHTPAAQFFNRPASREARAYLDGELLL